MISDFVKFLISPPLNNLLLFVNNLTKNDAEAVFSNCQKTHAVSVISSRRWKTGESRMEIV